MLSSRHANLFHSIFTKDAAGEYFTKSFNVFYAFLARFEHKTCVDRPRPLWRDNILACGSFEKNTTSDDIKEWMVYKWKGECIEIHRSYYIWWQVDILNAIEILNKMTQN